MIVYPISTMTGYNYNVVSVADDPGDGNYALMTVRGDFRKMPSTLLSALANKTFAITYGQLTHERIRTGAYSPYINRSSTAFKITKFADRQGKDSYAYNENGTGTDTLIDSICQVCHTQTIWYRNNGTLASHENNGD
jgi:hypothetical protein